MAVDPVCIVLNEREPVKERVAEELSQLLEKHEIPSDRISIDKHIEQKILERRPAVLVLDYLLGDFSTGLDVLKACQNLNSSERPEILFLTDEPDVQVAVEAMKHGARDYLQIGSPRTLSSTVECIQKLIPGKLQKKSAREQRFPALEDLIFKDPSVSNIPQQVYSLVSKNIPLIFISGEQGTGLSTLAHALHRENNNGSFFYEIDLQHSPEDPSQLFGTGRPAGTEMRIQNGSILLENIDFAEEEIFTLIDTFRDRSRDNPLLILTTANLEFSKHFQKSFKPESIFLPPLQERLADINPIIEMLSKKAKALLGKRKSGSVPSLDTTWLASLEWPGNLRQFTDCVFDVLLSGAESTEAQNLITQLKNTWEQQQFCKTNILPDRMTAHRVYMQTKENLRLAAIRLKISPAKLRSILCSNGGNS